MIRFLFVLLPLLISCTQVDYSQIKVTKVIDGDTVRLANGQLLRYIGLDTPEVRIRQGGDFIYQPEAYALEATNFNRQLVEGKKVRIEFDIETADKYGRLLGYCFVNDTFVNAKLIEKGYAVIFTFPPNVKYVDLFLELQRKARKNKRGLWSDK